MSGVRSTKVDVTTTGVAASAAGNTDSIVINGRITKIALNYHADAPNTTDITITITAGTNGGVAETIYAKANTATDVVVYPRVVVCGSTGTAAGAGDDLYDCFACCGIVNIALAQSDALTNAVSAVIFWEADD